MSAFQTMDPGVCAANCGQPIEVGDLVVMVNDEVVHLECENPEKAIAAVAPYIWDQHRAEDLQRNDHVHLGTGECVKNRHGLLCTPMSFDVDDAADPVRTIIAHSMLGAGLELTPNDVDRLRVILEAPKAGQPDVHWPCDCVPDLGDVHCHACSTAAGRTVRWADAIHGAPPPLVKIDALNRWAVTQYGPVVRSVSVGAMNELLLNAFEVREKADRG